MVMVARAARSSQVWEAVHTEALSQGGYASYWEKWDRLNYLLNLLRKAAHMPLVPAKKNPWYHDDESDS